MGMGEEETGGGGAGAADVAKASPWIKAAIRRAENFGDAATVVDFKGLVERTAKELKENPGKNHLKELLVQISSSSQQLAGLVERTVNRVVGLSIAKEDAPKVAQAMLDHTEDSALQEAIKKLTSGDELDPRDPGVANAIEIVEAAAMTEVVTEQLDDRNLEQLFNASTTLVQDSLNDVQAAAVKKDPSLANEDICPPIERGTERFEQAKEGFVRDTVGEMMVLRGEDNTRATPSADTLADLAVRNTLGVLKPGFAGTTPIVVLSAATNNPTGITDKSGHTADLSIVGQASEDKLAQAGLNEKVVNAAEGLEKSQDTKLSNNAKALVKAAVNRTIDSREEAADKAEDKKEAAIDAAEDALQDAEEHKSPGPT